MLYGLCRGSILWCLRDKEKEDEMRGTLGSALEIQSNPIQMPGAKAKHHLLGI